jgi:hypothetical protein
MPSRNEAHGRTVGGGGVNLFLMVSRNLFKSRPISLIGCCRRETLGAFDLFQ